MLPSLIKCHSSLFESYRYCRPGNRGSQLYSQLRWPINRIQYRLAGIYPKFKGKFRRCKTSCIGIGQWRIVTCGSIQFKKLGISYTVVSRSENGIGYEALNETIIRSNQLIINTTPLGMFPDIKVAPKFLMNTSMTNIFYSI